MLSCAAHLEMKRVSHDSGQAPVPMASDTSHSFQSSGSTLKKMPRKLMMMACVRRRRAYDSPRLSQWRSRYE